MFRQSPGRANLLAGTKGAEMENQKTDATVIAEFRKRKARQWIATALVCVAIALAVGFAVGGLPEKVVAPICIATPMAVAVFSLVNWRCPACEGYLGNRMNPKFCSKCGARLQE